MGGVALGLHLTLLNGQLYSAPSNLQVMASLAAIMLDAILRIYCVLAETSIGINFTRPHKLKFCSPHKMVRFQNNWTKALVHEISQGQIVEVVFDPFILILSYLFLLSINV